MAKKHGKDTVVKLDSNDLSAYTNNTEVTESADSHDTTTYGSDAHTYQGGLKDGSITISGIYDDTSETGPRAVIQPLVGTVVPFIYQPEGSGSGLPQDTVDVMVVNFTPTSAVAEMITWTAELQPSGPVDHSPQDGA